MQSFAEEKTESGYSWYALSVLMVVYVMNFLDRQIIYILFPLIKSELTFSDTQLALLGGTAFAIFYTFLGLPFGHIADKKSRTKLIAVGLTIWSLFSGLTGFANDFWTLFACRVMVGVGEATLGPAAISLLADYFSPSKRATVSSIYSMGIAVGAGLAALLGGYLSQFGWRNAFFIVGFPGILLAALVFFLREPERTTNEIKQSAETTFSYRPLYSKTFIWLCLGYGLFGLATNNISVWGAVFFNRLYETPLKDYGYWAGIATIATGIPATLFGGVIADRFRKKAVGGRMYFGALLAIISVPCWLVVLFSDNFALIIPAGLVLLFTALGWLGAVAADATEIAGAHLRGVAVAVYLFTINIAAYIIGANLIGKISDSLGSTQNPAMLKYALLVCPASCLLGAICLWLGGRSMKD